MATIDFDSHPYLPKKDRREKMALGCEELVLWIADLIKNGISTLYNQPNEFWEGIIKRLVDAQLSGLSNRLKNIQASLPVMEEEYIIEAFSELYFLALSIRKIDQFTIEEQISLYTASGFNLTKKNLVAADLIQDEWMILGTIKGQEDKIKFRRTWVQGKRTKFMGLILDYAWGKKDFMQNWQAGHIFTGAARVYPGSFSMRLFIENYHHLTSSFSNFAAYPSLESFFLAYANAMARNPSIVRFPVCLKDISVHVKENEVYFVDDSLSALKCTCAAALKWTILAASAGHKVKLFAEWNGSMLRPISLLSQERFIQLPSMIS